MDLLDFVENEEHYIYKKNNIPQIIRTNAQENTCIVNTQRRLLKMKSHKYDLTLFRRNDRMKMNALPQ